KRIRGFEIDESLEPSRRLHREIAGFGAAQDAVDIRCCLPIGKNKIDAVRHKTTGGYKKTEGKRVAQSGERDGEGSPGRNQERREYVGGNATRAVRPQPSLHSNRLATGPTISPENRRSHAPGGRSEGGCADCRRR